jgi:hypothetical protein
VLATVAPAWLRIHIPSVWIERYAQRRDAYRLPKGTAAQGKLAETTGTDGSVLLTAIYASEAPTWLRDVPAVDTLRRVWLQNERQTAVFVNREVDHMIVEKLPSSASRQRLVIVEMLTTFRGNRNNGVFTTQDGSGSPPSHVPRATA